MKKTKKKQELKIYQILKFKSKKINNIKIEYIIKRNRNEL